MLIQRPESLCGVCRNGRKRPARPVAAGGENNRPGTAVLLKWWARAEWLPWHGPILKTTEVSGTALFLPQGSAGAGGEVYLDVGLIEGDLREFCRVFPAIIPNPSPIFFLYPNTGDGHRHKMQGVPARRRCGRKPARKCRSEKVKPMLVAARNSGGHSTLLTHDRVNGSTLVAAG